MHHETSRAPFDTARFGELESAAGRASTACHYPADLPSTNDELAARLEGPETRDWPDFSVLGTDHQTAGHGRLGRVWTAEPCANLTFSTVVTFPSDIAEAALGWLPLVTGLSVVETLRERDVPADLKWPNDVLVAGRKICGILARLVVDPTGARRAVIGIGLNVDLRSAELPIDTATSMVLEGHVAPREEILSDILGHLERNVAELLTTRGRKGGDLGYPDRVRRVTATLGREVTVDLPGGDSFTGTATALDEHANLVVRTVHGEKRVNAGDVVHARTA